MIQRAIMEPIIAKLFKGKVITIMGARRTGKTTLAREILSRFPDRRTRYLNCDLKSVQDALSIREPEVLKNYLGDHELIVLDEAQNIPDAGMILKILVDTYPEIQIIATGSSSFDLANKTGAALTGRVYPFELYTLSLGEIAGRDGFSVIAPRLDHLLRFGSYPGLLNEDDEESRTQMDALVSDYLYKDVLAYVGVKKSSTVANLLKLLALQIGKEVAYPELGATLGIDRRTVVSYIDVLEQSFVVFRLGAFSRNLRKEISKSQKIYFYDVGVRNAIIQAYTPISLRTDIGALWENFCIMERIKLTRNQGRRPNRYFWRTYQQQGIDYIEESDGKLTGYKFKWSPTQKVRIPSIFLETYSGSTIEKVDFSNYWRYLQ